MKPFFHLAIETILSAAIVALMMGGVIQWLIWWSTPKCDKCGRRSWQEKVGGFLCNGCRVFVSHYNWRNKISK